MLKTKYRTKPRMHQRPILRSPSSALIPELLRFALELLRHTSEVLTLMISVDRKILLQGDSRAFHVPQHMLLTCNGWKNIHRTIPPNLCSTILIHVASSHWRSTLMDAYITWICCATTKGAHTHTFVRIFEKNLPFSYCSWCSLIQSIHDYSDSYIVLCVN